MRIRDIFIIVFILSLVAIIPLADGYLVKKNYLAFIKNFNSENHHLHVKVMEYSLGWLGSSVRLQIEPINALPTTKVNPALMKMTIDQHVTHGPYLHEQVTDSWTFSLAEVQSYISFPAQFTTLFVKQGDQSDLRADTLISFFGNSATHIIVPVYIAQNLSGISKVTWNGLVGDINVGVVDNHLHQIQANFVIGAVMLQSESGSLVTSEVNVAYDSAYQSIGLWSGKHKMQVPSVTMTDNNGQRLLINGLNLESIFGADKNNLYNSQLNVAMNNLTVSDLSVAPSSIKLAVNHLNAKAMIDLLHTLSAKKLQREQVEIILPTLIMADTTLDEAVNLNTSVGRFHSQGQIYWPQNIELPKTVENVSTNVKFKLDIQVSVALVNKVIALIYGDDQYQNVTIVQPVAPAQSQPDMSQPSEEKMVAQIDGWAHDNKIPLDISYQLKDLVHRKLANAVFAKVMDGYVVKKDLTDAIANQLKSEYALLNPNLKDKIKNLDPSIVVAPLPVVTPPPAPIVHQEITPAGLMHKKINDLIKLGKIKQDNDEYIISIHN
jgi:uncharacterized protein YdgA (DUF945 family)